ncbi:ABC transporter ATP-binding protein [bacterium]|nr:ABC transporter ATP-binding protein [candidate division CSSED10-310 bacterium]
MSDNILSVQNLARSFSSGLTRLQVLREITFDVNKREILVLTGASGVGKSTLLHLLGGLDRPTSGDIMYQGKSLTKMSAAELEVYRNTEIGFIFQFHHLLPEFTALENVSMPLMIRRKNWKHAELKSADMLEKVGLKERMWHKPGELSGGEQQRVAVARAMVTEPSIILADEPTGNLDEDTSQMVFDLMCRLNQASGAALVVATHNLNLAKSAHRWLRLTEGRVEVVQSNGVVTTSLRE